MLTETIGRLRESRVVRCLMAFILAIGVCTPFLSAGQDKAYAAGTIEAVDGSKLTVENSLMISFADEFQAVEPQVTGTSANVSIMHNLQANDGTPANALGVIFNDLDTYGETGYVDVTYPKVGTYKKALIGAKVRYTVSYKKCLDGFISLGFGIPDNKAAMFLHAGLAWSIAQRNIEWTAVDITFFDVETGRDLNLQAGDYYYSASSLNGPKFSTGTDVHEFLQVPKDSYSKIEYVNGGNIGIYDQGDTVRLQGDGNAPNDEWGSVEDGVGRPCYNWNSVAVYPSNGKMQFTIGDSANALTGDGFSAMWWQISTMPLANVIPPAPVKTVDKENSFNGDTLKFTAEQKVGTLSVDAAMHYVGFSMVDTLPANLTYTDGSAKMYQVVNGTPTEITSEAGSFAYDSTAKTLTYTFNDTYLANMLMQGETYRMEFTGTPNSDKEGLDYVENGIYSVVNNNKIDGNTTKTLLNNAALAIDKSVSKEQWNVGDTVDYKVVVSNTSANTVADNVVISDLSLPEGLAITGVTDIAISSEIDGKTIVGVPEVITHPLLKNGETISEQRDNSYKLVGEGTGWTLAVDYLPADAPITITFKAKAQESVRDLSVTNTASAVADNAPKVEDTAKVFFPSPMPPKYGHQVTVYKSSDPVSGSVVDEGDEITYSLNAINTGAKTAPFTVIRDYIPTGTTYVADSATDGGVFVEASGDKGAYVEWVINNIKPTEEKAVSYTVTVNDEHPTWIRNTALYGDTDTDPGAPGTIKDDPKNETNEIIHTTDPDIPVPAVLDLVKDSIPAPGTPVSADRVITYTLKLMNNGGTAAENAGIRDYIPEGTTYVENSADNNGTYNAEKNCVDWTIPSLEPEADITVSFQVKVDSGYTGDLVTNQAMFEDKWDGTTDPGNTSNIVEHPIPVMPPKYGHQVTVYKSATPASGSLVAVGDKITYSLNAVNTGVKTAPFTVIRDYIPTGTTYVEGSATDGGVYVSAEASSTGGAYVEYVVPNIAPTEEKAVSYAVTVNDEHPTWIRNTALYGDTDTDPGTPGTIKGDPTNETNEVIHTTDPANPVPAILDLVKDSTPKPGSTVAQGETITYTLKLMNNGGTAAENAGIRDYIPAGTTYVEGSADKNGTYNAEKNCVDWTIASLEPGKDAIVSFQVKVDSGCTLEKVQNQALFQNKWDGTTDPGNSSNIVEHAIPKLPTAAAVTSFFDKTGEWIADNLMLLLGIVMIALSLAAAGSRLLRKGPLASL